MYHFGVRGTVLIFSAIALNAVACSLVFQPAMNHSKHRNKNKEKDSKSDPELNENQNLSANEKLLKEMDLIECKHCQKANKKPPSIFSSQYLYNADDSLATGYEIIDPGTPMLALANDGWFSGSGKRSLHGSKMSLASTRNSRKASSNNLVISNRPSAANLGGADSRKASYSNLISSNRPSYVNLGALQGSGGAGEFNEAKKVANRSIKNFKIEEHVEEDCPSQKAPQDLSETEKNMIPKEGETGGASSFRIGKVPINDPNNNAGSNSITSPEAKYLLDNHSVRLNSISGGAPFGRKRSNTFNREQETLKEASSKLQEYIDHGRQRKPSSKCSCDEERREFLKAMERNDIQRLANGPIQGGEGKLQEEEEEDEEPQFTFWEKVVIFFDLDLLRDFTFVLLMIGVTIANFAELNFSILTPFVLGDFGFSKPQTALLMSLLASFDICVRFLVPFIAGKIGWENRTFFLVGVMMMAMGRVGE